MRVAIVHHWFVTKGGGERVAEVLAGMFPEADLFTLVTDAEQFPNGIAGRTPKTSMLQNFPGAKRFHRHLLPLFPLAVEQMDLTSYDLVLTSDSGPIKGVVTRPDAVQICYCHSPMRYVWDNYHSYQASMPLLARIPFAFAAHYVRSWDHSAAQRVTHFVANSNYVASRIQHYYGRSSTVVHPPIDTSKGFLSPVQEDYYLAVGRMVPYKRTEILIEACNRLGRRLRIVGVGPEAKRLRALAGPTIEFVGEISNTELWQTYARCRALLFAADEDFGMVPLEAQACGRPVIAFGKGGSLETVRAWPERRSEHQELEGPATGLFFFQQTADSLVTAIRDFEAMESSFSPVAIQAFARQFDTSRFTELLGAFIRDKVPAAKKDYELIARASLPDIVAHDSGTLAPRVFTPA
jgi:glycosyltransferase involved in cell wall biosynthesis